MTKRNWAAWELNHLQKFGVDPYSLDIDTIDNMPVEYITGRAVFSGRTFLVNQHVLIPRTETAGLVNMALEFATLRLQQVNALRLMDVGTGSGVIGITLLLELSKKFPQAQFELTMSDVSAPALKVARKNKEDLIVENANMQINFIESDLLEKIPFADPYDLIIANLPYVPSTRMQHLPESVIRYEPLTALDGGENGLRYIRKLLSSASQYLTANGAIILEVDDEHQDASEFGGKWKISIYSDLNEKNRYWLVLPGA